MLNNDIIRRVYKSFLLYPTLTYTEIAIQEKRWITCEEMAIWQYLSNRPWNNVEDRFLFDEYSFVLHISNKAVFYYTPIILIYSLMYFSSHQEFPLITDYFRDTINELSLIEFNDEQLMILIDWETMIQAMQLEIRE